MEKYIIESSIKDQSLINYSLKRIKILMQTLIESSLKDTGRMNDSLKKIQDFIAFIKQKLKILM